MRFTLYLLSFVYDIIVVSNLLKYGLSESVLLMLKLQILSNIVEEIIRYYIDYVACCGSESLASFVQHFCCNRYTVYYIVYL